MMKESGWPGKTRWGKKRGEDCECVCMSERKLVGVHTCAHACGQRVAGKNQAHKNKATAMWQTGAGM